MPLSPALTCTAAVTRTCLNLERPPQHPPAAAQAASEAEAARLLVGQQAAVEQQLEAIASAERTLAGRLAEEAGRLAERAAQEKAAALAASAKVGVAGWLAGLCDGLDALPWASVAAGWARLRYILVCGNALSRMTNLKP